MLSAACPPSFSLEVFFLEFTILALFVANLSYDLIYMSFPSIGLSYGTDDQSLKDAFSSFGEVDSGGLNTE